MPYSSKESNFEHEVIVAVIDTNYRWLIEVRSIDISLGAIHSIVFGIDVKIRKRGPLILTICRPSWLTETATIAKKTKPLLLIGITNSGQVELPGTFANNQWKDIE